MNIKNLALLLTTVLAPSSSALSGEHITSDGQGGYWTKDGHITSDGQGGYWTKDGHATSDGQGGFWVPGDKGCPSILGH
jgi:hypothetical protein